MTSTRALGVAMESVLLPLLEAAQSTIFADRIALYVAVLTDPSGLALAIGIRETMTRGLDPVQLRDNALAARVCDPLVLGAVPFELLATLLETLPHVDASELRTAAQLVRDIHAAHGVPLLVVACGSVVVDVLETIWAESVGLAELSVGSVPEA